MSKRFILAVMLSLVAASLVAAPPRKSPDQPVVANPDEGTYTAERAIIRDAKTGALRKPTVEETAKLVHTLKAMTNRSLAGLKVTTTASGIRSVDLNGGFSMVVIARPIEEGGSETICVATFDEAAQFLGLKQVVAAEATKQEGARQ